MKKFILAAIAIISIGLGASIAANYNVTQGSGTIFGSILNGGINYAQQLFCDATTPSQCAAVSSSGAVKVDGSGVTQPVSATSLPLPTGASTAAGLTTINNTLGSPFQAGGSIGNSSFASTQSGIWTVQPGNTANTTAWLVTGTGGTFPVTGTFWPYSLGQQVAGSSVPVVLTAAQITTLTPPTSVTVTQGSAANLNATVVGTGTFATQLTGSTNNINNIAGTISLPTGAATSALQTTINTTLGSPFQAGGSIGNTTFASTQSGTWNITNISGTVSLPTGAATAANQTNANQKTQIVDGSGNVIASTSNNLNVQCANCSGSGVSTTDEASFTAGTSLFAGTGGFFQTTATNNALTNGQQGMLQLTANRAAFTNLRNASGTEIGTASTPVQVSVANTGANGTAMLVTGTGGVFPATQSGIWTTRTVGNAGGIMDAVGQNVAAPANWLQTGCQFNTSPTTITSTNGSPLECDNAGNLLVKALQSGTWNVTNISGTVSLPTGASTSANQTNASQKTQIVDGSGNVIASTSNNLNVQCANCSGSGVSTADEATFTAGTSLFAGTGGFFQTTATNNALTNGQQGMWQMTANRAGFVNLRNASGTEIGTSSTPVQVSLANTGSNATAVAVNATLQTTATTAIGKVDPNTIATWGIMSGTVPGTAPTNTLIAGMIYNSSAPSPTTGQTLPIQSDVNGNLLVNVKSATGLAQGSTTSGQTGSLVFGAVTTGNPSYTTAQSNSLSLDTAGGLRIIGEGTAGTAAGGILTVQGVASMTPLLVNPGTASNWGVVTQGSTTAGQSGNIVQGAVTTATPGYTTAQTNPISLTPDGGLRVAPTAPAVTLLQNAAVANGNGTNLNIQGYTAAVANVICSVACSGGTTINFEVSVDNTTYVAINGVNIGTNTVASTTTTSGDWRFNTSGYSFFRARISAYSAGTISVKGYQTTSEGTPYVVNANIVANTATNQSVNVAQFGGVSTSTGQVAVSVAPVTATNTALVVDLRPDSPGIIALGQTTKSASVPVTIASDQYVDPCQSPNVAKSSTPINITTATTTSLVAISGSTTIYVCGISMTISEVITTPNTILFEYGTGATCGTGTTSLTGKYGDGGVTAGIPIVINAANGGTVFKTAASNGLCALTAIGATASFQGVLTYVQQ